MNMLKSKFARAIALSGVLIFSAAALLYGCSGGTDKEDIIGTQYVANGGSGSTIELRVDDVVGVADTEPFAVVLTDPKGRPLPWVQIFCETEHGIAIIEPSNGGVAFEHTGPDGLMSGVIGGLTPGSFMMECRAEEGFNLIVRKRIKVEGDVPVGFEGWPGAAGGNLGGGVIIEPPVEPAGDIAISQIAFATTSEAGYVDIERNLDCTANGVPQESAADLEPWEIDQFAITVSNPQEDPIYIDSVQFFVNQAGAQIESTVIYGSRQVAAAGTGTFTGNYTEPVFPTPPNYLKVYAGTDEPVRAGTYPVTFIVSGHEADGTPFTLSGSASAVQAAIDNCSGS